jgi:hypothetical protein
MCGVRRLLHLDDDLMARNVDRNLALQGKTDWRRWSNEASLEPAWDARAELAASFISAGAGVLDLGCGRMALQRYLPFGCAYQPCDLVARSGDTIVCDFNAGEFPDAAASAADVITVLGVLEYIADVDAFLSQLQKSRCEIVLSYCPSDLSGAIDRAALGWINHFALHDLAILFDRFGFRIVASTAVDELQILMRLTPTVAPEPSTACRVGVVSFNDVGNFGDRLGYHTIHSVLPAHCDVHHLTFRTIQQAHADYDLIVLGIGNSIFQPLLIDAVFDVVERAKAAVGVFGTQYRELIARPAIDRLLDRLDFWFARYQDDVLMYGRGRNNVMHLGDWLIDQFPMARATEDSLLNIGDEIWNELPLDRTIQNIQRHKNVFSTRLHPLLCALTSAELVAYSEQPSEQAPPIVSGKFRSMLIDVFGRTYPEKKFFVVDRDAVVRYKTFVRGNMTAMAQRLDAITRSVSVAAS